MLSEINIKLDPGKSYTVFKYYSTYSYSFNDKK